MGEVLDIAFFKFCYVDFNKNSNIAEIIDYYQDTINKIKSGYPKLKVLHITSPLYAHNFGIKSRVKNLLLGDVANVVRNKYNALLKNSISEESEIFDLASVESTYDTKRRASFNYDGEEYYALAKLYTSDGGHLNKLGKMVAAHALLAALIRVLK
jgi:hypothetical protein